jgi:hypothetical protein
LIIRHQVEIVVGTNIESAQHAVEHRPMLRGDANRRMNILGGCQTPDQRRHLDGFGARTDDG